MQKVNRTTQKLTGVKYSTAEQNKEMAKARQTRHIKNTNTLLLVLKDRDRNTFKLQPCFRIIMNGFNSVSVDSAKNIGIEILTSMTKNQLLAEFTFKRREQVTILGSHLQSELMVSKLNHNSCFNTRLLLADYMEAAFK